MKTSILAFLFLFCGCRCETKTRILEGVDVPPVPVANEYKGNSLNQTYGEPGQVEVLRIVDKITWESLWKGVEITPPPSIDFQNDIVICAIDKARPTGGYAVEIEGLRFIPMQDTVEVDVVSTVSGNGCVVTQADSRPYHFIVVAGTDWDVKPSVTEITKDCP